MNERQMFQAQVKAILTPALKSDGFRQAGPTFRRVIGEVIHVINLQGSIRGGQCCVCLGIHLSFLPTVGTNAPCESLKITEPECEFQSRLTPEGQNDHWWSYGTSEQEAVDSVRSIVEMYRLRAVPYFDQFSCFPADFTRVTPDTPDEQLASHLPPFLTSVRRDLALARIFGHLGDTASAHSYASRGLAAVGSAVALKPAFRLFIQHA